MGTFGPAFVVETIQNLGARAVVLVDCPVSGCVNHAKVGTLTAIVGTDPATFARIGPILAPLCGKTFLVGEAGKAAGLKVAVNSIVGCVNHALAEALLLSDALGLDPAIAYDVFQASVIDGPYVRYKRKHIFGHLRPADGTISCLLMQRPERLVAACLLVEGSQQGRNPLADLRSTVTSRFTTAKPGRKTVHILR